MSKQNVCPNCGAHLPAIRYAGKNWTLKEEQILRDKYSSLGFEIFPLLPNRSRDSIHDKIKAMGLTANKKRKRRELGMKKRRKEVAKFLASPLGYTNSETAVILHVSEPTIRHDREMVLTDPDLSKAFDEALRREREIALPEKAIYKTRYI